MGLTIVGYDSKGNPIYGDSTTVTPPNSGGGGLPWWYGLGDPGDYTGASGGGTTGGTGGYTPPPTGANTGTQNGKGVGASSGGFLGFLSKLFNGGGSGNQSTWGRVISAALPGIFSLFASKKAGSQTATDKLIQQFLIQQMGISQRLVGEGLNTLAPAINRFREGVYNPRAVIAPDLNARAVADRQALGAAAELAPRGGASSDFLSRLPFTRIGEDTTAAINQRNASAGQLGTIGANLISSGGSIGRTPPNDLSSLQSNQFNRASQTGQGIYQIVKGIVDAYNNKKTTTTTDPSNAYLGFTG